MLAPRIPAAALSEPALRLEVARALGTAGAVRTAAAIAQSDLSPGVTVLSGPAQRDRAQSALASDEPQLMEFEDYSGAWLGEWAVVPLLQPLEVGDRVYRFARVTKGVSRDLVGELREGARTTQLFQEQHPGATAQLKSGNTVAGDDNAAIVRPGVSLSSVELLESRRA